MKSPPEKEHVLGFILINLIMSPRGSGALMPRSVLTVLKSWSEPHSEHTDREWGQERPS